MADKSLDGSSSGEDIRYDHKWGFTDTYFKLNPDKTVTVTGSRYALSGTVMHEFLPFVEEMLDIKLDYDNLKPIVQEKPVPPARLNDDFYQAVQTQLSPEKVSVDDRQRLIHSHGQTTADEVYKVLYGALDRVVDMVLFPESQQDVELIVELAGQHDVCLVPYGGGTSVSCALQLPQNETRSIVSVDMRRMNKILWIDHENFRAGVQAGISGKDLEERLERVGYTSGHEPDSLELSTLGGWIATNASGMKKNKYGNIEDIVESVTMVTSNGIIEQGPAMPRQSLGIDPKHVAFGSEGNLGIITSAVIKIHKLPEAKKYGSLVFPTFQKGTEFLYELSQTGTLPASIRLLDNIQFRFGSALKGEPTRMEAIVGDIQKFFLLKVKGFDPNELCAATIVMEGTQEEVNYQSKLINRLAKRYGGIAGGSTNGQRGYMLTYAIAYIRDFLTDFHIIGETYETTVPWNKVQAVIDAVAAQVEQKHKEYGLPGRPYISPRITQLYHTGVCIYFTHGFSTMGVENPDEVFSKIEHTLRETIMAAGGSISHHHGVGKIRKDFMKHAISPAATQLIKEIKQANDPQNIFGIRNNVFAESTEPELAAE
ncbi:FAD-binding oxidoreductase [Candidatus Leptofilum sp.]|uniref:FAD-binding oxidoreductase n=1 Tax=Candidatus Leptofilum sp. TaxID=3241576 RepID=UPI003B5AF2FF